MRVVPELSMFIVACEIDGSDLARERERHFRTGKRADNLHGHDSISTSAIGVVVLRYKFRTSFRLFSRCNQNAWDLHKLCTYEWDNAVWNDFKTHFQHK